MDNWLFQDPGQRLKIKHKQQSQDQVQKRLFKHFASYRGNESKIYTFCITLDG